MGWKEFAKKGLIVGLMVCMTNPVWDPGKVLVMYSCFCDMEGLVLMAEKSLFGLVLIKK